MLKLAADTVLRPCELARDKEGFFPNENISCATHHLLESIHCSTYPFLITPFCYANHPFLKTSAVLLTLSWKHLLCYCYSPFPENIWCATHPYLKTYAVLLTLFWKHQLCYSLTPNMIKSAVLIILSWKIC